MPPFVAIPPRTSAKSVPREVGRRSTGLVADASRRSSFLRYAGQDEGAAAADTSLVGTRGGSRTPALPAGGADEPAVAPPEGRSRRQSFLRSAGGKGGAAAAAAAKEAAVPAVVSPCKNVEQHEGGRKSSGRRPSGGRVGVWASTW